MAGDQLELSSLDPQQHFTKPPTRYSEAALVRELEKKGVGRPSTYASIISTIQERGYARITNKRLFAEKIGDIVTDRLLESFNDLMDYGFTAAMEDQNAADFAAIAREVAPVKRQTFILSATLLYTRQRLNVR